MIVDALCSFAHSIDNIILFNIALAIDALTRNRIVDIASQREAVGHSREHLDVVGRFDLDHDVFSPAPKLQRERMVNLCKTAISLPSSQ